MSTTTFWMPQVHRWINANDRMHWGRRARDTRVWRNAGLVYARKERLPKLEHALIDVLIHKTTARRYDAMNLYPTIKALVDGFVEYGLLPDDDNEHLLGPFISAGAKHPEPGLTIHIKALEPQNAT